MALADGKVRLAPRSPPTVRQQLLDYYRCLQRWRVRYAPQSPTEELHPCFLEAIKNLDIVEYYLDCSVLPDPQTENELRKYWEGLHERLEKRNEDCVMRTNWKKRKNANALGRQQGQSA